MTTFCRDSQMPDLEMPFAAAHKSARPRKFLYLTTLDSTYTYQYLAS